MIAQSSYLPSCQTDLAHCHRTGEPDGRLPALRYVERPPPDALPLLEQSQKDFGFIPGLHKVLAGAPPMLDVYKRLYQAFQASSFDKAELTVVWQTINVEHGCHYCVPAHSGIARLMKVDSGLNEALRNAQPLADAKLNAPRDFTLAMLRQRGVISDDQLQAFYGAGYGPQQVLEVILGISQKVMSNYANHVAGTPVDETFSAFGWSPVEAEPV